MITGDHETGGMRTNMTGEFDPASFCHFIEKQMMSGAQFGKGVKKWKDKQVSFNDALNEMKDASNDVYTGTLVIVISAE